MWWGWVFSLLSHQKVFFPKWGKNLVLRGGREKLSWVDENAHVQGFIHVQLLFLFSFFLHPLAHTHFFAKKCVTFFVLFNGDIIVNLYQLYFPSSHFSS